MTQFERRSFATKLEVRASAGKNYLVGRAASYGVLSADLGGFREVIAPGAFSRAVREKDDCVFTLNHSATDLPYGRVSSGTLVLTDSKDGLDCRCELGNSQQARDLMEAVRRQDIREMSFAFQVPETGGDEWGDDYDENGLKFLKRTLRMVKPLFDVSAVLRPAYPSGTSVSAQRLTPPNVSNLLTQVSARTLQRVGVELRARGMKAPVKAALWDEADRDWMRRERFRKLGIQIREDDANATR
jgi:HK97 family phage prohead protease